MQQPDHIDDILLGAFIDGQLDAANAEVVLAALQEDPDTRERLYQLRRAKDLMKVGFDHVEAPPQATPPPPKSQAFWVGAKRKKTHKTTAITADPSAVRQIELDRGERIKAAVAPSAEPRTAL